MKLTRLFFIFLLSQFFLIHEVSAWKETHGGDGIVAEFKLVARSAAASLSKNSNLSLMISRIETAIDLTEVRSQDRVFIGNVEKDAVNYPNSIPPKIVISRTRYSSLKDKSQKIHLALHEYLFIAGYDDSQYFYSNNLMVEIQKATSLDNRLLQDRLYKNIKSCDIAQIKDVLELNPDNLCDIESIDGLNAFHLAAIWSCSSFLNLGKFTSKKCDINSTAKNSNYSPLVFSLLNLIRNDIFINEGNWNTVKNLLMHNATISKGSQVLKIYVNNCSLNYNNKTTPIIFISFIASCLAARNEIDTDTYKSALNYFISLHLTLNINTDATDENEYSSLGYAVSYGNVGLVEFLLKQGFRNLGNIQSRRDLLNELELQNQTEKYLDILVLLQNYNLKL